MCNKLPCRRLISDQDLLEYQQKTEQNVGILLPIDYLKRGQVYGHQDSTGQMVGGFILITHFPFRAIDSIPQAVTNIDFNKMIEINGLWFRPKDKTKSATSLFWIQLLSLLILTMFGNQKFHLCYAYTLKKIKLQKIYGIMKPKIIYRGPVKPLPGNTGGQDESIEMVSLIQLLSFPYKLLYLWKAAFLEKKTKWAHYLTISKGRS